MKSTATTRLSSRAQGEGSAVLEDEEEDEYYEYNDDRPTSDPVERPTDQRGERPMRAPAAPRMGPSRERTR